MANKKRPVVFISKKKIKPFEERKGLTGLDMFDITYSDGIFHQWGSEMEEGEETVATQSVAIIEDENGHIHTPIPNHVQFTDK